MKMIKLAALCGAVAFGFGGLGVMPVSAQATRTWVSGVGDDANPCSRTAPCKTFAGAISKTATGGEINCLDPGGFGGVTIVKSISIQCEYTEGGVLSAGAGVNGIIVNATSTSRVFLSGIDFNGAGNAQNGLRILVAASVDVRNSIIRNYGASNGLGVSFQPSGATNLTITDSTIANNGNAATGGGILIQPTGAGGTGRVSLVNVHIVNNSNNGFRIDTTGNTNVAGVNVTIDGGSVSGNANGVVVNGPAGTTTSNVLLVNSTVNNNTTNGILASGTLARIRVGNTSITGNGTGVAFGGGAIVNTYGNNYLNGNTVADGTFTLPAIGQN